MTEVIKVKEIETLVETAKKAQAKYENYTQEQVDAIVKNVYQKTLDNAEKLAISANEETGFGKVSDKIIKNTFASEQVYESIKDLPTVGVINRRKEDKIIEIGIPLGVVAGLIPSTNPTATVIFKSLIALKTRNAIVFSPHPKALKSILMAVEIIEKAAVEAGAPAGLVQVIQEPTLDATSALMKHADVSLILATGGKAMVQAAYSSGNPAIGVGPGNVPVLIDATADIPHAIDCVISSKTFDNGIICASEQALVVDKTVKEAVIEQLKAKKAYFMNEEESAKVSQFILRETGTLNPDIVGKSASDVAKLVGISVPEETSILISEQTEIGHHNPYSREKLTPILGLFTVDSFENGVETCRALLANEGTGHTAVIHTTTDANAEIFGLEMRASRILVNTLGALGAIGATTKLAPSMTLGCGAMGGSSTTDNVTAHHLMNVKRIAYGVE
ncbi:acetaldehyde dehydrogenase (acetylating) [Enterococcus haemoperoxidus ATCC BAA-382]|uniref:Acetaldehyde dehydrogenase (Acetylating) n=1 Tax=Enterococcus haemoperoxidus ATCC BAA-382 TaxID=1158608 RepID=R2STP7_9ENTE|nr:acetaldehyde dehydrogenase (acetylating) [Enterococcus haemoperoxidus]EOH98615.1 acetaldehyde dehydrogenase (acetylating) [Enterococcus haemoperoxidus ATCC BAA-382]EOT62202.1 acetaldehyde dehydrogenase (acetylating) [Enterococcus haemoperoxidus ATCC BAA-382]OJG55716.1 acetaldehyde dehydrogenase (acetylating) [Enterococcus haemoperoxidus]